MSQIADYQRGYRDGVRRVVTWLHDRAKSMNDPHATALLNVAANDLGIEFSRGELTFFAARNLRNLEAK